MPYHRLLKRLVLLAHTSMVLAAGPALAQEAIKVGLLFTYSGPSALAGQLDDNTVNFFQQKFGTSGGETRIEFVRGETNGPNPETARRLTRSIP